MLSHEENALLTQTDVGTPKVARALGQTMLRASTIAKLPVMSADAKATVMASRAAPDTGNRERQNAERWQMLQDYYCRGAL